MRNSSKQETGTLYLVATPIGNLKDITFRAVETLKSVDLIAAEDTRHTRKLLTHYEIKNRLVSYHDHNKEKSAGNIIKKLSAGWDVALVSDAGTPGISDPGFYMVRLARKNGIQVTACPGACAAVTALSISGIPSDKFSFFGFLPVKKGKRKNFLKNLANENKSMVFYESNIRVQNFLEELFEALGDRYTVVVRELTKLFEETVTGRLSGLIGDERFTGGKGEFTIIVSAEDKRGKKADTAMMSAELKGEILSLLESGTPLKVISLRISEVYDFSKKESYALCLELKSRQDRSNKS